MQSPRVELKEFDTRTLLDKRIDVLVIGGSFTGKTDIAVRIAKLTGLNTRAWAQPNSVTHKAFEDAKIKVSPFSIDDLKQEFAETAKIHDLHIIDDHSINPVAAHKTVNCYSLPCSTVICGSQEELLTAEPQFDIIIYTSKPPKDIVHVTGEGKHSSQFSVYNMVNACQRSGSVLVFDARFNRYGWLKIKSD